MPETKTIPACPECGRNDFKGMQGRAIHRYHAHGVKGTHKNSIIYHAKKNPKPDAIVKASKRNGATHEERETQANQNAELHNHIACAFGIVQSKLESYAASNGIPQAVLAEGVAHLLRTKTGR